MCVVCVCVDMLSNGVRVLMKYIFNVYAMRMCMCMVCVCVYVCVCVSLSLSLFVCVGCTCMYTGSNRFNRQRNDGHSQGRWSEGQMPPQSSSRTHEARGVGAGCACVCRLNVHAYVHVKV